MNLAKVGKISSLSLSPKCVGERVRVRGHLTDILLYHPSLSLFPLRDLAKGPPSAVVLISILKSGSDIPYSSFIERGAGLSSSPLKGRGTAGGLFAKQEVRKEVVR
jgi:hypothetical protein